ncbi:Phage integrase family [Pseudovibrio sp. FO-BEG1]|uniref:tyrosine-type recombinase/integrase n=1 Tax=Pseudovibrio sp. (strain FO-BEG1) TaxID=911045 RepID=UPI000238C98A|nr:site-specific integrase [Pseudovibrio sp. FO-BEG1]AEV34965.1 Phage integrase family [Pseudovibrio sp. FO-BEG1]
MAVKLTKTTIDRATPQEKDYFIWDAELKGFGLKVAKGGRKTYVCKYRHGTGRSAPTRRYTIGPHGTWTPDQARREAQRILGKAANGEDPAKQKQVDNRQLTVSQLCADYLLHGTGTKKVSTLATDKGRIERHIKPLIGNKRVDLLTKADVKRFMQDIAEGRIPDIERRGKVRAIVTGGKGAATRSVGLLGGIYSYAIEKGLVAENPVHGVKRYADKKNELYLSEDELIVLGKELDVMAADGANASAVAIIQLLIFTGARRGEIEQLKWSEVDLRLGYLRLEDSKTGQKNIRINAAACEIIEGIPKLKGCPYVFPAQRGEGYYQGAPKVWRKLREKLGFNEVRLHDLRHSFASLAISRGASLPMIGALLGHRDSATTQRYAHLHEDPIKAVSDDVGLALSDAMKRK